MTHHDNSGGCLAGSLMLGMVGSWIGSGIIAWNWIEPDSFGRVLIFLLAWGALSWLCTFVLNAVILLIGGGMD